MTDERPIGYWLKLVDRLIDEMFEHTIDEHGVTRRQWQLLNVLSRGAATVEQLDAAVAPFLAGATGSDADQGSPATPAESSADHLTELIESGWVDATTAAYELTDRGRTALDRLTAVVSEQRTRVTQGVSPEDYRTTVATLERIAANLAPADS